jgi:hypothetical protein
MEEKAIQNRSRPRRNGRRGRYFVAGALIVALLFGGWLVTGNMRADGLARAYFLDRRVGTTVANVTIDAESPWVPPFWSVRISGDVIESGGSNVAYRSYMWLLIEPFTGSVVFNGAG